MLLKKLKFIWGPSNFYNINPLYNNPWKTISTYMSKEINSKARTRTHKLAFIPFDKSMDGV